MPGITIFQDNEVSNIFLVGTYVSKPMQGKLGGRKTINE